MSEFEKILGAATWLSFFANHSPKPDEECREFLRPYLELRGHVTALQSGAIEYMSSDAGSRVDEFLNAAREIGCSDVINFCDELNRIFLPAQYPKDRQQREEQLARIISGWDGESEPFPELEERRLAVISGLRNSIEGLMLEKPEKFQSCCLTMDPFAGNVALAKLRKRMKAAR